MRGPGFLGPLSSKKEPPFLQPDRTRPCERDLSRQQGSAILSDYRQNALTSKLWCQKAMEKTLRSETKATEPSRIVFNRDRCKGCTFCVYFCAKGALEMSEETNQKGYLLPRVADESKCSGCRLCEAICPDFALRVISVNADEEE